MNRHDFDSHLECFPGGEPQVTGVEHASDLLLIAEKDRDFGENGQDPGSA